MRNLLSRFAEDNSGATAIEYALLAAFIAVALVGILQQVGTELKGPFSDAAAGLRLRP